MKFLRPFITRVRVRSSPLANQKYELTARRDCLPGWGRRKGMLSKEVRSFGRASYPLLLPRMLRRAACKITRVPLVKGNSRRLARKWAK
jgi:hypothetical protein